VNGFEKVEKYFDKKVEENMFEREKENRASNFF
jgi:hypothetical protein